MAESSADHSRTVLDMDTSMRVIIYCLGAFEKPVGSRLKLQKMLFLSSLAFPDFDDLYTFQKYREGPYSERIDTDVAVLNSSGFMASSDLRLTDEGEELYKEIEKRVKEPLKSIILENKEFVSELTEEELLTFIYVVFPKYTVNSEVWDRIKKDREKNALSMFKKELITASQAAKVAGMGYYEFEGRLKELNIRWKS